MLGMGFGFRDCAIRQSRLVASGGGGETAQVGDQLWDYTAATGENGSTIDPSGYITIDGTGDVFAPATKTLVPGTYTAELNVDGSDGGCNLFVGGLSLGEIDGSGPLTLSVTGAPSNNEIRIVGNEAVAYIIGMTVTLTALAGAVTLGNLSLSDPDFDSSGVSVGDTVADIVGATSNSTITVVSDTGNQLAIEGTVVRATATLTPGSYTLTLEETLAGATNSPLQSALGYTVT